MENNSSQDGYQNQFSSTDALKKRTIDWVFEAGRLGCKKQESIADYTYATEFINAVKFAKSQLWKYTPPKIRLIIKGLYMEIDSEEEKIDKKPLTEMNDKNKLLAKQKKAYENSVQVLELLFHVVQNSPLSVEFREMEVKDFKALIETIRVPDALNLFSGEIDDDE
jgi:hypothetical protein